MADTTPWTRYLIPEIARPLEENGPWLRVEESRKGGWYCLHGDSGENAIHWSHLSEEGRLTPLDPLSDKRLPALSEVISQWIAQGTPVELLAWRLGSRAIFRLGSGQFAKVFRKDRQIVDRWKYLVSESGDQKIRIPEVADWDSKNRVLTIEAAPGESLNSIWKSGIWDDRHLKSILKILRWLGSSPVGETLPTHSVSDEVEILEKRNEVFHRILAQPSTGVHQIVTDVVQRLNDLPEARPVICHRDFHDKQVLISENRITLLDLDLLAISDPALDAGNILAHLRLRALQGLSVPWEESAHAIVETMAEMNVDRSRLLAWTASTFTRLLLIYSRRNRPEGLLDILEQDLNQMLDDSGKWQGVFS